jgi:UDP-N-acetylglucosamine 1-carboxyvinyltransferase
MDVIRVSGNKILKGQVTLSGAKNSALPILAATLLTSETCTLNNVPELSDTHFMIAIMEYLGAHIKKTAQNTYQIQAKQLTKRAPYELVRKMRASICLLGPLIGRLKEAEISLPGGCVFGPRPIDLHLKGLQRLGCKTHMENGYIHIDGHQAKGNHVFLGGRYGSTVLGTANLLMAATLTPGITHIESAACEPEIIDLAHMLVKMGAKIEGIGSPSLLIEGVDALHGCEHSVMGDRIEAGTYLIAGAITQGDVTVKGLDARYLGALLDKLEEMGHEIYLPGPEAIQLKAGKKPKPIDFTTLPYPGFPTDLQAQMCALLALTPGLSIVTERIYPNRFMHVPELQRMGAQIAIEGPSAIITGQNQLSGAPVMASDLRASVALILAGLKASGNTWIQRIYHLDRGYENLVHKFQTLGADIERLPASAMPISADEFENH